MGFFYICLLHAPLLGNTTCQLYFFKFTIFMGCISSKIHYSLKSRYKRYEI